MINTPTEFARYVATHAHRPQGGPWAGPGYSYCVELVFYAGGFTHSFANATLAGEASNPILRRTPQIGDFLYWTDHIGLYMGNDNMICASEIIPGGSGGINILEWEKHFPRQHYLGATPRFGAVTLEANPIIIPDQTPPKQRKHIMYGFIRRASDGQISIINPATGHRRALSAIEYASYTVQGYGTYIELADGDYNAIPQG